MNCQINMSKDDKNNTKFDGGFSQKAFRNTAKDKTKIWICFMVHSSEISQTE